MTGQQLRVFVSSKMDELAQEREIIKRALSERGLEAWVFERDSGARPGSIQQTYLAEVEAADLYLGIFWKGYGPYTVDEFEQARLLGMDCLVYEKREAIDNGRDPQLQAFLDRLSTVEDGVTIKWFRTAEELGNFAKEDITAWQARVVREKREKPPCHYVDVPSIQGTLVGRDEVVQQLVRSLREGHIRALAVEGLPGVGKTTLAVAIAHHAGVMRYFRDGVLWASLGQNGTPMNALSEWGAGLDEEVSAIVQPEAVARRVKDAIGTRRMLLILDDIWDIEIANLLRCGGSSCSYLLTTRDKAIAQLFAGPANTLTLEQLRDDDAFEMLRSLAPEAVASAPDTARDLLRAVGSLPLAVSLVGGYLAAPQHGMFSSMFPELRNNAMTRLLQRETRLGLTQARLETAGRQRFSLSETIEWSLQRLPPAARVAFHSVGVFAPKPARFSLEAARAVTDADDAILALLAARNLIELHPAQHELSVHPVLADVARPDADASARFQAHYLAYLMSKKGIDAAYLRDDTYNQIKKAWQTALSGDQLLEWLKHLSRYLRNTRLFGDYLSLVSQAITYLGQVERRHEKAVLLVQISEAYNELHEWETALKCCNEALAILEEDSDRVGVARVQFAQALYNEELNNRETAHKLLLQAVETFGEEDDFQGVTSVHLQLYELFYRSGLYEKADEVMEGYAEFELANPPETRRDIASDIPLVSIAKDRSSSVNRTLSLGVIEYYLARTVNRGSEAANIVFGVKNRENGADFYYYLRVWIRPGEETITKSARASEPITTFAGVDLFILGDERTLLKLVLEPGSVSSDDRSSLEVRGDWKKFDVIRALSRV